MLTRLPLEIAHQILDHLPSEGSERYSTLYSLSLCSKALHRLTTSQLYKIIDEDQFDKECFRRTMNETEYGLHVETVNWLITATFWRPTYGAWGDEDLSEEEEMLSPLFSPSRHSSSVQAAIDLFPYMPNLRRIYVSVTAVKSAQDDTQAFPDDLVTKFGLLPSVEMFHQAVPPNLERFRFDGSLQLSPFHYFDDPMLRKPTLPSLRWFLVADKLRHLELHNTNFQDYKSGGILWPAMRSIRLENCQCQDESFDGLQHLFSNCPTLQSCYLCPTGSISYPLFCEIIASNRPISHLTELTLCNLDTNYGDLMPQSAEQIAFGIIFPNVLHLSLSVNIHPLEILQNMFIAPAPFLRSVDLQSKVDYSSPGLDRPFQQVLGILLRQDRLPILEQCKFTCGLGREEDLEEMFGIDFASQEERQEAYYSRVIEDFKALVAMSRPGASLIWACKERKELQYQDNRLKGLRSVKGGEVEILWAPAGDV